MSRRSKAKKREIAPDYKYGDILLAKFINCVMWEGKKFIAEKAVYGALDKITAMGQDGLSVFNLAMENTRPGCEVKSRRVGGATYQIPVAVSASRANALAMRWIINFARARKGSCIMDNLRNEILDAAANKGSAVKKREDTFKMAEANKAFAHFRY